MLKQRQALEPYSARINRQNSNAYFKSKNTSKHKLRQLKQPNGECMYSISPWDASQFSMFGKNGEQEGMKKKIKSKKQYSKPAYKNLNLANPEVIKVFDFETMPLRTKKRTKTQMDCNTNLNKVRLNTIEVFQNLKGVGNQKYFSQDCRERKMSMAKFKQMCQQTGRSKLSKLASNTNFIINSNFQQKNSSRMNTQTKTEKQKVKNQNQTTLMFYFQAKSSKNMMERQKNIMKIRNILIKKPKIKY